MITVCSERRFINKKPSCR